MARVVGKAYVFPTDTNKTVNTTASTQNSTYTGGGMTTNAPSNNATATQNGQYGNTTVASTPSANVTSGISTSTRTTRNGTTYNPYQGTTWSPSKFSTSDRTDYYSDLLSDTENSRPDAFTSKYEGTIQNILDGILNRDKFDVTTDNNYSSLYDLYSQQYQANASRSMRDAMGSSAGLTGGYGSTASQIAGQQAYDQTMQGLNDRSIDLMNLAYGIYSDDRANDYNKLGAVEGLDNTDYSRYRDTVNDWQTDRNYYANRYDTEYNNDYNLWGANNDYNYNVWNTKESQNFNDYLTASQEENTDYWNAINQATDLAKSGLAVPTYLTDMISRYSGKSTDEVNNEFSNISAQALASAKSGGRSGSGSGGGDYDYTAPTTEYVRTMISNGATDDEISRAINLSKNYYSSSNLSKENKAKANYVLDQYSKTGTRLSLPEVIYEMYIKGTDNEDVYNKMNATQKQRMRSEIYNGLTDDEKKNLRSKIS